MMPTPFVINDNTWTQVMPHRFNRYGEGIHDFGGHPRILNAREPEAAPGECEDIPGWVRADDFQLIPRDEWDDRIAQKDKDQSWLEDIVRNVIPCTDQNGLGYCHAYGTIAIGECQRLVQGHEFVALSAESVGGPITGWRNRGADPTRDIQQMSKYGACPKSMMDREWSLSPSRWEDGWEEAALKYRVHEWRDMRTTRKMFDAAATMALLGMLPRWPYWESQAGWAIRGGRITSPGRIDSSRAAAGTLSGTGTTGVATGETTVSPTWSRVAARQAGCSRPVSCTRSDRRLGMNALLVAAMFAAWPTLPDEPGRTDWPTLPPVEQVTVAWPDLPPVEQEEEEETIDTPEKQTDETPGVELIYIGAAWCSTCPDAKKEAEKLEGRRVRYLDVDQDRNERWVQYCLANLGGAMPRFILLVDDKPWQHVAGRRDVAYLRDWLAKADDQWRAKNGIQLETYRGVEIETPTARAPPRTRVTYGCGNLNCVMCYGRRG
jgi:hypothetical protein